MDLATPLGMAIAFGALAVSILMDGGHLSQLWNTSALILVVGGTIGMTMTTFPLRAFLSLPGIVGRAFKRPAHDYEGLIKETVRLAEMARKEGLLALQEAIPKLPHPILQRGLAMAVDGVDPQVVKASLHDRIELEHHRLEEQAAVLEQAGGYAPTVGIIGTVMGLVHVLGNLSDAEKLGPAIAVAFMATFYGIFTANLFWLPLGAKIKGYAREQSELERMLVVGVLGIQTGESPSNLRERLEMYSPAMEAKEAKGAKGKAGKPRD